MSYVETIIGYVYEQYCYSYNMEESLNYLEDQIDLSRDEIKKIIEESITKNKNQFEYYYNSLVERFKSKFSFSEIICKKEKIKWPKKSGVYVIWKNDENSFDNLIYVGMTGKYKRVDKEQVVFNSGSFDKRDYRYTPYRFCESLNDGKNIFTFRYGPKGSSASEQSKIKYQEGSYEETIPYSELKIHCFYVLDDYREVYTPELLEKEILTKYLKSSGNLPPANNEL